MTYVLVLHRLHGSRDDADILAASIPAHATLVEVNGRNCRAASGSFVDQLLKAITDSGREARFVQCPVQVMHYAQRSAENRGVVLA